MMGTLATVMAGKKIATPEHLYWAEVEGDIENVNSVLKITTIRVKYHLKVPEDKIPDAKESFANYITRCPAAQSVMGCIKLEDELLVEIKH
jgi:organic hydroperoxide reductase OsmC/OhrA